MKENINIFEFKIVTSQSKVLMIVPRKKDDGKLDYC